MVRRDLGDAVAAFLDHPPEGLRRVRAAGEAAGHRDDGQRLGPGLLERAHAGVFLAQESRELGGRQVFEVRRQLARLGAGVVAGLGGVDRDAGAHGQQVADQRFGRRAVEQHGRGQLEVEALLEQDLEVDGAQRVEAEVEEVLVRVQLFVGVEAEELDDQVEHVAREQAALLTRGGAVEAREEIGGAAHGRGLASGGGGRSMVETWLQDEVSEGGAQL